MNKRPAASATRLMDNGDATRTRAREPAVARSRPIAMPVETGRYAATRQKTATRYPATRGRSDGEVACERCAKHTRRCHAALMPER
jgi:hypothetical protein